MTEEPEPKRAMLGTMSPEMKQNITEAVDAIGEVERYRKPHRKGPGPVQARVLPPEDLVHEKKEEIRRGQANRIHYICSNPMCTEPIRAGLCFFIYVYIIMTTSF